MRVCAIYRVSTTPAAVLPVSEAVPGANLQRKTQKNNYHESSWECILFISATLTNASCNTLTPERQTESEKGEREC